MNLFDSVLRASALDFIAGFSERVATEAGAAPAQIRAWKNLHRVYVAETHSRQKQRLAVDKARRNGFSVDQLAMIERRLKPLKSRRERSRLRLLLLDARSSYRALERLATKLIPPRPAPSPRATFGRSSDGLRTLTLTAPERDVADLEHAAAQGLDPTQPRAPQLVRPLLELMRGGGVPRAVPRPLILVPLAELTDILRQQGDETILGLSDGTTTTGAQLLNDILPDHGLEAALFHPKEGPVNLYRAERFANQKQRDLARATAPVCPVPSCKCPADDCQIHHVEAWNSGGQTNMNNLAVLCRYHNRMNEVPGRGRIILRGGAPVWRSPRGAEVPNEHHCYGAMTTLFSGADPGNRSPSGY